MGRPTTDIKLSVVIVNYNVKYFLEQALLSVRKASARLPVEIWVVDNNSVDGSVPMVREKFPEVRLIANPDNPGFSIANNQAIRQSSGKYILLLNPDTLVEEDTFEKCLEFMDAHPEAGGLGVKMIDGSGAFLPESKRGFPSPMVAFYKAFGLSRLFPRSRMFNRYHLGYLDPNQTHAVEVLSGAFMLLRRSVLDEIGLLDEAFFMYGEDIDLSYRIVQAGYKNYYFPATTIIHYKGESTRKGSLNYVRTFYQAMIIFARKHFQGDKARLFILMIQLAIYFRATLTLIGNLAKRWYLPVIDALLIGLGLHWIKTFWATHYFKDPGYYPDSFYYFNLPLYLVIWLGSVYFSGGYDSPLQLRKLTRGLVVGTFFLAAVYGFLPLGYRSSRAIIVLGAAWAILSTLGFRSLLHFMHHRNFNIGREKTGNLIIVGSLAESKRVLDLYQRIQVHKNFIGTVSPQPPPNPDTFLGDLNRLDEVVYLYRVNEIVFCGKDISTQEITSWMSRLGPEIQYKIVPRESLSIIGSSSKNSAGRLYTVDIQFNIATSMAKRNKRLVDLLLCTGLLLILPVALLAVPSTLGFLQNWAQVLIGKKTWVGYKAAAGLPHDLPKIRPGVLHPFSGFKMKEVEEATIRRVNFFYAKDYRPVHDLELVLKGWRDLGSTQVSH